MGLSALWWWIDRWRKSSAFMNMNLEQQGAYRNLLDEATLRGGALPNDQRILAKASGDATRWRKVKPQIMRHFELKSDGFWHNETLDKVLAESHRRAEKQREYRSRVTAPVTTAVTGNNGRPPISVSVSGSRTKKKSGANAPRRNSVCPHTPRCATWTECTALIVDEGRRTKAAKS